MHCGNESDSNLSKEFAPQLHRVLPLNAGQKSRAHGAAANKQKNPHFETATLT
jgi:hypothetical protein